MTTRVAVITANLGSFDRLQDYAGQDLPPSVEMTRVIFTDSNFPPRTHSLTPRLQARIPKMFGWQMCPGYDYYIWVDASCALLDRNSVAWFLKHLTKGCYEIALFRHPDRHSIREEADFLRLKLAEHNKYLTPRYAGEDIDGQLAEIMSDPLYKDDVLYASTALAYADTRLVRSALKEWWYHTSRYHSIDQLSLPYVVRNLTIGHLDGSYLDCPYLTYTRNLKHADA